MDALFSVASPIHFYDTERHAILCGLHGFPDRSTKHWRTVTCPKCVERLADARATAATVDEPFAGAPTQH